MQLHNQGVRHIFHHTNLAGCPEDSAEYTIRNLRHGVTQEYFEVEYLSNVNRRPI